MKLKKILLMAMTTSLTLLTAACFFDGSDDGVQTMTMRQFAINDFDNNTTDTATPIEINDLVIDISNEDPEQFDDVL